MTTQNYSGSSPGAKEQAQQAADTAAQEGRHVAGVTQSEARNVAQEARSQVHGLLDQVTTQVDEQSRSQRDRLVGTLRTFGDDLEKMAAQGDGGIAAELAQQAAERARSVSSHLDGREPRELLDDVRSFARRRPGTFLLGAMAAGVVVGRLTRGAKAANDGGTTSGSADRAGSPLANDVTSPGDPLSMGAAAPSSGPVSDPASQGSGTASGDPLAGVGTPETPPVYPSGAGATSDTAAVDGGLPNPAGSVAEDTSWTDAGARGDRS
jgi:hypothetical protein